MIHRQTLFLFLMALTLGSCSSKPETTTYTTASLTAYAGPGMVISQAALDSPDRTSLEKQSPRTLKKIDNGEPLSTDDIKKMTRAGISDDVIIRQIEATNSTFYLSSADIVDMKKAGVSQRVISYMVQTGNQ